MTWRGSFGPLAISAGLARTAVTDSVLSYAGLRDPLTRAAWGGVRREGLRVDLAWVKPSTTTYLFGGLAFFDGEGVLANRSLEGGAGVEWKLPVTVATGLRAGLSLTTLGYQRNTRFFTLGHNGYFSPQAFVHAGGPVRFESSGRLRASVVAEPGVNWFREEEAPVFPLAPTRRTGGADGVEVPATIPGQTVAAFAFNGSAQLTMPLGDVLETGLRVDLLRGAGYSEARAMVVVDLAFARGGR